MKPPLRRVLDEYLFKGHSHSKDPGYAEYLAVIKRLGKVGTNANIVYAWHHIKPQLVVGSLSKKPHDGAVDMWAIEAHLKNKNAGLDAGITGVTRSRKELAELYSESYSSPNSRTTTSTNTGKLKLGPSFTSPGFLQSMGSLRERSKETFARSSQVGLELTRRSRSRRRHRKRKRKKQRKEKGSMTKTRSLQTYDSSLRKKNKKDTLLLADHSSMRTKLGQKQPADSSHHSDQEESYVHGAISSMQPGSSNSRRQ